MKKKQRDAKAEDLHAAQRKSAQEAATTVATTPPVDRQTEEVKEMEEEEAQVFDSALPPFLLDVFSTKLPKVYDTTDQEMVQVLKKSAQLGPINKSVLLSGTA